MKILEFIFFWLRADRLYNRIKCDEEKSTTSTKLGVKSIIYSIVGLVFVSLCLWGVSACWERALATQIGNGTYEFPITMLALMVVIGFCALVIFVQTTLYALILMIYQFKLNGRGVRFVALATWVACIIGEIVLGVIFFLL